MLNLPLEIEPIDVVRVTPGGPKTPKRGGILAVWGVVQTEVRPGRRPSRTRKMLPSSCSGGWLGGWVANP